MPRISQRRVRPAGFTLVELMVVIALVGVMTALVIPEMRGTYSDAVLRAGSRDLIAACALASSRAIAFNQTHRLLVVPATGKFRIERRIRGAGRLATFAPVRDVSGCEGQIDERVVVRVHAGNGPQDGGGVAGPDAQAAEPVVAEAPGAGLEESGPSRVGGPPQAIAFYPDGTADRVEVQLRDREGFGLVLQLNPITARLRVRELPRP